MSVSLTKGGRADLSKSAPNATRFAVGLSWDAPAQVNGHDFDLDVTAFGCTKDANGDPKAVSESYMVYYNNLTSPCLGIVHSGDNLTGAGAGDDETIIIDISKLDAKVEEIAIIVTLHMAIQRGQNFGQAKNPKIRIYDPDTGTELTHYDLDEDYSQDIAVQFGSVYKRGAEWKFNAIGVGFPDKTLAEFGPYFGVATS